MLVNEYVLYFTFLYFLRDSQSDAYNFISFPLLSLGWGMIKPPASLPGYHPILQQAMMPPIEQEKCKDKINAAGGQFQNVLS